MKLYFATTNPGKVQSLQRDLGKYNISVIQEPIDLIEPRSSDVIKIANYKMTQAYSKIQKPTIVIDAGFYIDELNGFPKAFVNFSLETIGIEGIVKLLEGKERGCEFKQCLAYKDSKLEEPVYIISNVRGKIAPEPRGEMQPHLWSKLGLIFIPEESDKTLAEMTTKEYSKWRKVSREKDSMGAKLYSWLSNNRL